jgi:hypothetical protein
MTTIRRLFTLQSTPVFSLEERRGYADADMSPGQKLVQRALALGIEGRVKPTLSKGAEPILIIKALAPGIKG